MIALSVDARAAEKIFVDNQKAEDYAKTHYSASYDKKNCVEKISDTKIEGRVREGYYLKIPLRKDLLLNKITYGGKGVEEKKCIKVSKNNYFVFFKSEGNNEKKDNVFAYICGNDNAGSYKDVEFTYAGTQKFSFDIRVCSHIMPDTDKSKLTANIVETDKDFNSVERSVISEEKKATYTYFLDDDAIKYKVKIKGKVPIMAKNFKIYYFNLLSYSYSTTEATQFFDRKG